MNATRFNAGRLIQKSIFCLGLAAFFCMAPESVMARDAKYDQAWNVPQASKQAWASYYASLARNAKPTCAFNHLGIPYTSADIGSLASFLAGINTCDLSKKFSAVADAIWRSYLNDRNPVYVRFYEYKTTRSLRYDSCTLYIQVGNKWVGGGFDYTTGGSGGSCLFAR